MVHLLFIDPLEKLSIKKDSTLMLAATMKNAGMKVFLLFEKDFFLVNHLRCELRVYDFNFDWNHESFEMKSFELLQSQIIELRPDDYIHMRIDPPFDTRYLRYLWMLRFYQDRGIKILNSPDGILKYNEKLYAYTQKKSHDSFVGSSLEGLKSFIKNCHQENFILKPLDLYQGMGVVKFSRDDLDVDHFFQEKVKEYKGAVVVQTFCEDVKNGEIRSIYFKGKELGSILKIPRDGNFLANIAQGASYKKIDLKIEVRAECERICRDLMREGVYWVAFDILEDFISEVNITCPGLLVEVSKAHHKNLASEIIAHF